MSLVYEKITIEDVDGPHETWTRKITFKYEGARYWVTLNYHTRYGYSWDWFDKSGSVAKEPEWISKEGEEYSFYNDLGEITREW